MVEVGRAELERARHAGAIDFDQQIVLQVQAKIEVQHLGSGLFKTRTFEHPAERRKDHLAWTQRISRSAPWLGKELVKLRGREHSEPDLVPLAGFSFGVGEQASEQQAHRYGGGRDREETLKALEKLAAEPPRQAEIAPRESHSEIRDVAAEELVTALAAQRHFDVRARKPGHQKCGEHGRVGQGLVQMVPQELERLTQARLIGLENVVMGLELARHTVCISLFAERLLREFDGKRVDVPGRELAHDGDQQRGIDAAAQKDAQRHVAH